MTRTRDGRRQGSDTDGAPLGIKLLAVLGFVVGLFGTLGSLVLLGTPLLLFAPFVLAISVGQMVVSVGLWNLRPWAYTWTLILQGLGMLADLAQLLLGDAGSLFSLLVSLLIVAYVVSKSHLFRER